jgi:hypothetical protein
MNDQARSFLPAFLMFGLLALLMAAALVLLGSLPASITTTGNETSAVQAQVFSTVGETSTDTATATESPRPTWTLRPSETPTTTPSPTPTATPTRERFPTLTPARPFPINARYGFNPQSADLMDQIAKTIADYPDAKFSEPEERRGEAYQAYFIYPALIYQEALLRYPAAEQSEQWMWGLAYSMARLGDPQAVVLYQRFLLQALNRPDLALEDLPDWFRQNSPDLSLEIHQLDLPAAQGQFALMVMPEGRMVYLLQNEAQRAASLYPLTAGFNFSSEPRLAFTTLDMDGDGKHELALYLPEASRDDVFAAPGLFSLKEMPPKKLPVGESLSIDFKTGVRVSLQAVESAGPGKALEAAAEIFPPCPLKATRTYRWDGQQAVPETLIYTHYAVAENLSYCEPLLALAENYLEPAARVEIIAALLPLWPPAADPQGRPYPQDAKDELRFRLAVNLALLGQPEEARAEMEAIARQPSDPAGNWPHAATSFADALTGQAGLYLACRAAPLCDLHTAVQSTVDGQTDIGQAVNALRQAGAQIGATGSFDFDQDGQLEGWFTLRQRPNEQLEFWLLAEALDGVQAVYISTTTADKPAPYWSSAANNPGVFQIEPRQGYRMRRLERSRQPVIEAVRVEPALTTTTRDTIIQAEQNLLGGQDPRQVRDQLLALRESGRFNCLNHRVCDRYFYALGLAAELAGDESLARDLYIELWWEESASPLTAAARLKLFFIPRTATPTPTPSPIPTETAEPSETASPTATLSTPTQTP